MFLLFFFPSSILFASFFLSYERNSLACQTHCTWNWASWAIDYSVRFSYVRRKVFILFVEYLFLLQTYFCLGFLSIHWIFLLQVKTHHFSASAFIIEKNFSSFFLPVRPRINSIYRLYNKSPLTKRFWFDCFGQTN